MPARTNTVEEKKEIVVFWNRRESRCTECGKEICRGGWLTLRERGPLCLECADLDHLVFLPSGDTALTRRSKQHSRLHAVVLEWARARKRYERQGLLVEEEALARAEEECLADADVRERRRVRSAERRDGLDREYVARFAGEIRRLYPHTPAGVETGIAEHACRKYSGRVGRSAAAKEFDADAITLAVRAHIRHACTHYDELLMAGWDRRLAREQIHGAVDDVEKQWHAGQG